MTHAEQVARLKERADRAMAEITADFDRAIEEYDRRVAAGDISPHPVFLRPWIVKEQPAYMNVERVGNEHMPEFADEPLVVPAGGGS